MTTLCDNDMISDVLSTQLSRCANNMFDNSTMALIHYDIYTLQDLRNKVTDYRYLFFEKLNELSDTYSHEWPAVIVLLYVSYMDQIASPNLANLYLAVSRARVWCSVLLYPGKGKTLSDYSHVMRLVDNLRTLARVVEH